MLQSLATLRKISSAVFERDYDPILDDLRWRLHLRLLLISAALTGAMLVRNLLRGASLDLMAGLLATLLAWALLRRYPRHNRYFVRVILLLFVSLGLKTVWLHQPAYFPAELLALMIMPVFATLLDGVLSGGLVTAAALTGSGVWLLHRFEAGTDETLAVVFCALASVGLYLCCVAHTWIFISLVRERRQATDAVAHTHVAVEQLAETLSESIFEKTNRLQEDLRQRGLQGLDAAFELIKTLQSARKQRPTDIPTDSVVPEVLLEELRRDTLRLFLFIGLGMACVALAVMLMIYRPLWKLAASMALFTALLTAGSWKAWPWRWRLRGFIWAGLTVTAIDIALSGNHGPSDSVIFLPTLMYFACMLDRFRLALLASAVSLTLIVAASVMQGNDFHGLYSSLVMIIPALVAVSAATLPMYRTLLSGLSEEEARLSVGLGSYRRLMSTFFHDLANPLAVLSGLAQLPKALQTPEDADRALRMAGRVNAVALAARQALQGTAPTRSHSSLTRLSEELYDLFRERLQEKELQWVLNVGPDLDVVQSGPLLRDSVLGNLLSNAVKFSPNGGRIELSGWESGGSAHVMLKDTGRGIPAHVIKAVEEDRVPSSSPGTEGETGNGYGLLLAKTYMKELGGKLVLRHRVEGGTEAELILPLV